ncbi:MAG: pyruvate ferredoxin oxidoreductase [Chloroflexi bacterium]|nr:pyruvate ferredoxin oxidoreductase [Chloroflexota bacterium]
MLRLLDGNAAASYGAKLARTQIVSATPITPASEIAEHLIRFIEAGELRAEFVVPEGEHSTMVICMGASMTGARVFTATASQGLAYMHEPLHFAAGGRLPIVMAVPNRSIALPWCNYPDHQIVVAQRDTGWIQLHCENAQEVLDTCIQAFRIAEDPRVLLPVMVCFDGWTVSLHHEGVDIPPQDEVDAYLPAYTSQHCVLDPDKPKTVGAGADALLYMQYRRQMEEAMDAARAVIKTTDEEFRVRFGRSYGGMLDQYRCEDAAVVLVGMGALAEAARAAADELRLEGAPVGVARIRSYRPFPHAELRALGERVEAIAVVDRSSSPGLGGPLASEVRAVLSGLPRSPQVYGFVAGLGGHEISVAHLRKALSSVSIATGPASEDQWLW